MKTPYDFCRRFEAIVEDYVDLAGFEIKDWMLEDVASKIMKCKFLETISEIEAEIRKQVLNEDIERRKKNWSSEE